MKHHGDRRLEEEHVQVRMRTFVAAQTYAQLSNTMYAAAAEQKQAGTASAAA